MRDAIFLKIEKCIRGFETVFGSSDVGCRMSDVGCQLSVVGKTVNGVRRMVKAFSKSFLPVQVKLQFVDIEKCVKNYKLLFLLKPHYFSTNVLSGRISPSPHEIFIS